MKEYPTYRCFDSIPNRISPTPRNLKIRITIHNIANRCILSVEIIYTLWTRLG